MAKCGVCYVAVGHFRVVHGTVLRHGPELLAPEHVS